MTSQNQASTASATPIIVNPFHLHDPTPNGYSTAVIATTTWKKALPYLGLSRKSVRCLQPLGATGSV
jgi:hypothetical protein